MWTPGKPPFRQELRRNAATRGGQLEYRTGVAQWQAELPARDMSLSFGSTGDCFDNAAMETFWARSKVEIAWIRGSIWFETRAEARAYLFEFIEVFDNRQRHQEGPGHLTPTEYADKWRHDHGQPNPSQPRVQQTEASSDWPPPRP